MGSQWSERRTPIFAPPDLDALGGKSYNQASQTPGALGGRRARELWFTNSAISLVDQSVHRIVGGTWRLIGANARARLAPSNDIVADMLVDIPGQATGISIFVTPLTIASGQKEAAGGVIKLSHVLLPVGTLVYVTDTTSETNYQLTMELHYRIRVVAQ